MSQDPTSEDSIRTTIAPWLSVRGGVRAIEFYKAGFGAVEVFHIEDPDGNVVSRLSVDGAEFWISDESPEHGNAAPFPAAGNSIRMVLTVADPDAVFDQAVRAGALAVSPVTEEHGWRVGRIADPCGHHWEIGREVVE